MRDTTKLKAPHVGVAKKKKPFSFFKETDKMRGNESPFSPLTRKRLSK